MCGVMPSGIKHHDLPYMLTIWIFNPYGQHDAGCMDYDAPGHQSTQPDINDSQHQFQEELFLNRVQ